MDRAVRDEDKHKAVTRYLSESLPVYKKVSTKLRLGG
jgi:hypothetical protein